MQTFLQKSQLVEKTTNRLKNIVTQKRNYLQFFIHQLFISDAIIYDFAQFYRDLQLWLKLIWSLQILTGRGMLHNKLKSVVNNAKCIFLVLIGRTKTFIENPALSVCLLYEYLSSCKVSIKSFHWFLRKSQPNRPTDQQTNRPTNI